jgi:hypothetical protein
MPIRHVPYSPHKKEHALLSRPFHWTIHRSTGKGSLTPSGRKKCAPTSRTRLESFLESVRPSVPPTHTPLQRLPPCRRNHFRG